MGCFIYVNGVVCCVWVMCCWGEGVDDVIIVCGCYWDVMFFR